MAGLIVIPFNTDLSDGALERIAERAIIPFGGRHHLDGIADRVEVNPETHPRRNRLFFPTARGLVVQEAGSEFYNLINVYRDMHESAHVDAEEGQQTLAITDMPLQGTPSGYHRIGNMSVVTTFEQRRARAPARSIEARTAKVVTHEIGHTFFYHHGSCVMQGIFIREDPSFMKYADIVREIDAMPAAFCRDCNRELNEYRNERER